MPYSDPLIPGSVVALTASSLTDTGEGRIVWSSLKVPSLGHYLSCLADPWKYPPSEDLLLFDLTQLAQWESSISRAFIENSPSTSQLPEVAIPVGVNKRLAENLEKISGN